MSRVMRYALGLACALLPLSLAAAHAQNAYYTTGTYTIDAAHSVVDIALVGLDSMGNPTDSMGKPYNPTVNLVTGGSVSAVGTFNSSIVNMSGGFVDSDLGAFGTSTVNVSGGLVGGFLYATETGTINLVGGVIGDYVFAVAGSTLNVSGGSVATDLEAYDTSQVTISGGMFGQYLGINFYDGTTGTFTLIGSNLSAVNMGADTNGFDGTDYALSGTLQDGTNISGYILNVQDGSTFTLQAASAAVPEPDSIALLAGLTTIGAGFLARRRRFVTSYADKRAGKK